MKGKYDGIWSIDDLFQAFFQDREFFRRHHITHVRAGNFYFTPCNAQGTPAIVHDEHGMRVDGYETAGRYHCAADALDLGRVEPITVFRH